MITSGEESIQKYSTCSRSEVPVLMLQKTRTQNVNKLKQGKGPPRRWEAKSSNLS